MPSSSDSDDESAGAGGGHASHGGHGGCDGGEAATPDLLVGGATMRLMYGLSLDEARETPSLPARMQKTIVRSRSITHRPVTITDDFARACGAGGRQSSARK